LSGLFFATHAYNSSDSGNQLNRIKTKNEATLNAISKLWFEGTYRSVGLGVSEGLQYKNTWRQSIKPLQMKNPITDYVLKNNLSIACLQMDALWHYNNKADVFMLEGNITFKGDHSFNKRLNNSVLYTRSFYSRNGNDFSLMSTSIDISKPRDNYKQCSNTDVTVSRNIRFDNYLEQMNSLTYPSGYLNTVLTEPRSGRKSSQTPYISNEEYIAKMNANVPVNTNIKKTAQGAMGLFTTFLSIPELLNGNNTLAKQELAITADIESQKEVNNTHAFALDIRIKYLSRMALALDCDRSNKYKSICKLGGGVTYN
jgi:hypothetical protein